MSNITNIGKLIYNFALKLKPEPRSITGNGVRATLTHIKEFLPNLNIIEVPTGTKVFDWEVPREWEITEAWILTPEGEKICNFAVNHLHLVGYSVPIDREISLAELQEHLHSDPDNQSAIPYVTSYYKDYWGFCLTELQRLALKDGIYKVHIASRLFEGSLTYGELLIPGKSKKEIFLSTYICHPTMANNELSGPSVTAYLANWISNLEERRYSYRIVFLPETIGSITYLATHYLSMQKNIVAGFNVTCVGDERAYSYLPTRLGNTLSDKVAIHVLRHLDKNFISYRWTDRGSDERQYCAPGIDLPIASIMRTKYREYPEYHTSLDDFGSVVTEDGLAGGFNALRLALEAIEANFYYKTAVLCDPHLGSRGLYPTTSTGEGQEEISLLLDIFTWSDGSRPLLEIADLCGVSVWGLYEKIDVLLNHNLLIRSEHPL